LADEVNYYRRTGNCAKLLQQVSLWLNYYGKYKVPDFVDNCPREYLGMICSADGQTDWTRAVWLIYSTTPLVQNLPFNKYVLDNMETKLL
jgi:hypothetical protein